MNQYLIKNWNSIKNLMYIVFIVTIIYISFMYLIPFLSPFVAGIIIAIINAPFVRFFEVKFKIKRSISAIISLIFTFSLTGGVVVLIFINIYNELLRLQNNLENMLLITYGDINKYVDWVANYYKNLPPNISSAIDENLRVIGVKIESGLTALIAGIIGTVSSIPKLIVFTAVMLLSAYFISSDFYRIKKFFFNQFPARFEENINGIRIEAIRALMGYMKAVATLMAFTFAQVSVGLMLIGADYALLMGALVGLADAIPVLGTGMIMAPWIIWCLIIGNVKMALWLTVIFVLGVVIRQIIEPKILGDSLGLHPLVTLFAMYIGMEVFGVIGLFIGPFTLIILKSFQKSGVIRIWREEEVVEQKSETVT